MAEDRWEHFSHGADIGVRGIGSSKEQAFEQAAVALTAVVTDPHGVAEKVVEEFSCEAPDDELLLADWLNTLIYAMSTRRLIFGRFNLRIDDHRMAARAWGEEIEVERHQPAVEVKGATYTALRVGQDPEGTWVAQCVVDV